MLERIVQESGVGEKELLHALFLIRLEWSALTIFFELYYFQLWNFTLPLDSFLFPNDLILFMPYSLSWGIEFEWQAHIIYIFYLIWLLTLILGPDLLKPVSCMTFWSFLAILDWKMYLRLRNVGLDAPLRSEEVINNFSVSL